MNWQAVIDALRREQVSSANAATNAFNRVTSPFSDPSKEIERLNLRAELAAMMAGALEAGLAPVAGNGPPCHSNGFWEISKADLTRQSTAHAVCSVCGKPAFDENERAERVKHGFPATVEEAKGLYLKETGVKLP